MTVSHGLTSKLTASATSPGSDAIGGGFTRLNPADGLFLRAEHLERMQRYAGDLAAAVGAGLGPGVVYGFTCRFTQQNDAVEATAGLAFAAGQPLRSGQTLTVSLKGLAPSGDDFWVVEIVPATWLYGSEPVYGGLCEDPCGNGSGIRPYAAEGVELRLRHDSIPGFGDEENRRNWLASNYFERERQHGGASARSSNAPWLMPNVDDGGVLPIAPRPWPEGSASYDDAAVPLGVVWKDNGKWQLDVWTARRDLGDPTPMMAWQWRLAWRPRRVFMAQILQFQAQLAQMGSLSAQPPTPKAKQLIKLIDEAAEQVAKINSPKVPRVTDHLEECRQVLEPDGVPSLQGLGFDELPPAGYLPVSFESLEEGAEGGREIFGEEVDVRVRFCRADYVAHAVEQVQHMDRIPLKGALTMPKIDLLVPQDNLVDLEATMPRDGYGWSAFVRRRDDVENEQPRDQVKVFVLTLDLGQEIRDVVARIAAGETPPQNQLKEVGTVSYPAGEWAVPNDEPVLDRSTWLKVHELLEKEDTEFLGVLGYAREAERQPLAAVRASLLLIPTEATDESITLPDTYVVVDQKWPEEAIEAIVVVLRLSPSP
jgi:hypothetical protein